MVIDEIEQLREELHDYIKRYGLSDERTIQKSQELDKALNNFKMVIAS